MAGSRLMNIDPELFDVADEIAEIHLPPKLFGWRRRLINKIRLRQAIYDALCRAALRNHEASG